ncbi:MAG: hypothetical protein HY000_21045 [Planctomycetes bacterium]|nr:hypothetical protein [Planctomycetota bacterium]
MARVRIEDLPVERVLGSEEMAGVSGAGHRGRRRGVSIYLGFGRPYYGYGEFGDPYHYYSPPWEGHVGPHSAPHYGGYVDEFGNPNYGFHWGPHWGGHSSGGHFDY